MTKANNSEREGRPGQKGPTRPGGSAAGPVGGGAPPATPPAAPVRVAPLFRGIDWLALAITFGIVWTVYFFTLAPELTLEDSGELVTGSYYAGIPHPPGYPVWTIYSWLWTELIPWGNMEWRVALGEATLGALACGLVSLMVSRGSSMFMESIEELKDMTGTWESAICVVSGLVSGLLMGLDGFVWRESVAVNRIAVTSVPWFLVVLLCIMRWVYAPHQHRFLYWALFVFGICITTHQSLLVGALGIEVAIAAVNQRLGRDVFFGNFVIYMMGNLFYVATGTFAFNNLSKEGMQIIFHGVGICSLLASGWLGIKSKTKGIEIGRNLALLGLVGALELAVLYQGSSGAPTFYFLVAIVMLAVFIQLVRKTWSFSREWLTVVIMGVLWCVGVSFYLYMAVSGMTNPPMQWGYPRTVEGFFHALTRGQYEQPNPTNLATEPLRFLGQVWLLVNGVANEYSWALVLIAMVPFFFFHRMQKRERAWLISLSAIYLFLGVFLIILFNPTPDRASADLVKVFFCNSHTIVAALIGYGLALTAAFMATHYHQFRRWGMLGGGIVAVAALYCLWEATGTTYFGPAGTVSLGEWPYWIGKAFAKNQFGLPIFGNLVLVAIPFLFVGALAVYRERGPLFITLCLFAAMPLYSGLAHFYASNQRNHWFGYWFGHDMFTPPFSDASGKPLYPEMAKDAVLYGGTDPGRFCPTYMIFVESFTPHECQPIQDQKFDRRDVYIITQNALADGTYLDYIRAHYNRSTQIDPPFFSELLRSSKEKEQNYRTNLLARMVLPLDTLFEGIGARVEKRRRTYTSWFNEKDFVDLPALAARLRPGPSQDPVSKYLYEHCSPETQRLLGAGDDPSLRRSLARDLNVVLDLELQAKAHQKEGAESAPVDGLYNADRFKGVTISEYLADFIKENPQGFTRVRFNRLVLESAYPKEIAKSLGGVYPDREMYIATPEDSQRCFQEYLGDAQKRLQHDMQFPNEPKQIRPGEDVRVVENRVTVAGQVAVMAINGLLTKVMFDHNPKNEFYVEESFPLDWMYPHLTPYGVIMKINRQPLPSLSEDILRTDHEFWKQFSKRLTGDFIDYDTSLKAITDWIEKTYLHHDFNGFTGDRKFIHDDDGQKAFSKLRSSIGGIYAWRLSPQCPPEYRPKTETEYQQLLREAEFTFRQAFAFCPYSPEAVFRYVNLLLQLNRLDDALLIAETCLKFDPYNSSVIGLRDNLRSYRGSAPQPRTEQQLIEEAGAAYAAHQTNRALQILDAVVNHPQVSPSGLIRAAQVFGQMGNWARLEAALEKLVKISPDSPEAWYDLAAFKANIHKDKEALPALGHALELSAQRLQHDPKARDLMAEARKDDRFAAIRPSPEFQKLVPPK